MFWAENPWPGVLIGVVIGTIFLVRGAQKGLLRDWVLGSLFLLLGAGAYFVEAAIVTPAEEVEQNVKDLVQACVDDNVEQVLDYISVNNVLERSIAQTGMRIADVQDDMRVTDLSVRMEAKDSRAISHFRANGTWAIKNGGQSGHAPTRWELTWQQEAGAWKIIKIKRLNPVTGEEMSPLKPTM